MNKRLFLLTLGAGLIALPPFAGAKDKDKDKDKDRDKDRDHDHDSDRDKKYWKELRDDVRELQEQYRRLSEMVNVQGVPRHTRDDVALIGVDVQRVSAQFDRGNFDYKDLRDRVSRLMNAIRRTRDQFNYDNQHRPRYYPR